MNKYKNKYLKKYNLNKDLELDFDILKICSRIEIEDLEELYFFYKYEWLNKMNDFYNNIIDIKQPQTIDCYIINKMCYFLLRLEEVREGKNKRFNKNNHIIYKYKNRGYFINY